jgi:hypothetical protein
VSYRGETALVEVSASGVRLLATCRPDEAPAVGAAVGALAAPGGAWLMPGGAA